jgi:DeoR family transcriptional regulator, copper-sensing transcriptional repressor
MSTARALSAIERQNRIIELLAEHGSVQVDDLENLLGVSKMTVHRDLDTLEADGQLRKVHGGAALAEVAHSDECTFCHGTIPPDSRSKVTLHMVDGSHHHACCPHCGLLALPELGATVTSALVTDFLYGRVINARVASYVVNPTLQICCEPTTLAFQNRADAERFQRGFGGQMLGLAEAVTALQNAMALTPSEPA